MTKRKALGSGLDSLLSSTRQTQTNAADGDAATPSKIQVQDNPVAVNSFRAAAKEDTTALGLSLIHI